MSKINVLTKEVAELIAAGEVIERPVSVIKELVENSVDAGATHIVVETKHGGITYMRVTDDGCGIAPEDVPTAFIRHATSKILNKEDLDSIFTLGFRGEALASVSAVSRVELMTKRSADEYGTRYRIEGTFPFETENCGCPDGTTVIIRDLFYNVPVRQKFLKKDITEANAISQLMQKLSLSHPEISFKIIRDNRLEFNTSGDGDLFSAIYAIYGREFANDLIPVNYEIQGIAVKGYIIKPLYARPNRLFQHFFVNKRFVKSKICSTALESGYENLLMQSKFPACVLMIEIPPVQIDVNIHPAKAEVRFSNEKFVSDSIYFAIKNALHDNGLLYDFKMRVPVDWSVSDTEKEQPAFEYRQSVFAAREPELTTPMLDVPLVFNKTEEIDVKTPVAAEKPVEAVPPKAVSVSVISEPPVNKIQPTVPPPLTVKETEPEPEPVKKPEIRIVGEVFKNYIMAEIGDEIVIIDKHAAHERLIFERLKNSDCRQYSQMLLHQVRILMTAEEMAVLSANVEKLQNLGFSFDFTQAPYVIVTAAPDFLCDVNLDEVVPEIAENLRLGKQNPQTHKFDDLLHSLACKSAVRANDINAAEELRYLAEQIYFNANIRHCPHGRPVMFTLTKNMLERQFKRY